MKHSTVIFFIKSIKIAFSLILIYLKYEECVERTGCEEWRVCEVSADDKLVAVWASIFHHSIVRRSISHRSIFRRSIFHRWIDNYPMFFSPREKLKTKKENITQPSVKFNWNPKEVKCRHYKIICRRKT